MEDGSKLMGSKEDTVAGPLCMHRVSRRNSVSRHKFAYITLSIADLLGVKSSLYTHTDELLRHGLQP